MNSTKKRVNVLKKIPWMMIGILCLILLFALLIVKLHLNNHQAMMTSAAAIYFEGEYSIDGGEWHPIEENQHIPATRGDVTLRGYFHMAKPNGTYIGLAKK